MTRATNKDLRSVQLMHRARYKLNLM